MIYNFCKGAMKLVNIIFLNYTVRGMENIPDDGNYIICGNHISLYDPVLIGTLIKRPVHFMAKAELYKNRFLNWFFLKLGTIPVDRGKVAMDTLRKAMTVLKEGELLGIFPEGTRVEDRQDSKPLDGFVVFSLKTQSPIIPVKIEGKIKFRGKVNIIFGKPIELTEFYGRKLKTEEMSKISKKIMDNIYDLQ